MAPAQKSHSELVAQKPGLVIPSFANMVHNRVEKGVFPNRSPFAEEIPLSAPDKEVNVKHMRTDILIEHLVKGKDENGSQLHPSFIAAALLEFFQRHKNGNKAMVEYILLQKKLDFNSFLQEHAKPLIKYCEEQIELSSKDRVPVGKGFMRTRGVFGG